MGTPILGDGSAARARISTFYNRATWIEGRAEEQLEPVAGWPGMVAVAGFPDLQPGRYGPVGAAFLADRIWPQLVGPDIGCGMALFCLELLRRRLKLDKAARRLAVLERGAHPDHANTALNSVGLTGSIAYARMICACWCIRDRGGAGLVSSKDSMLAGNTGSPQGVTLHRATS